MLQRIPEVVRKGKFGEQWEGPFEIREVLGKGTYKLTNVENRKEVPQTWNATWRIGRKCHIHVYCTLFP